MFFFQIALETILLPIQITQQQNITFKSTFDVQNDFYSGYDVIRDLLQYTRTGK